MNCRSHHERQAEDAAAFRDLESDICDISDMATICAVMVERFAKEQSAVANSSLSAKEASDHLAHCESSLTFAVYHLCTMTKHLREKYYEKANI